MIIIPVPYIRAEESRIPLLFPFLGLKNILWLVLKFFFFFFLFPAIVIGNELNMLEKDQF